MPFGGDIAHMIDDAVGDAINYLGNRAATFGSLFRNAGSDRDSGNR